MGVYGVVAFSVAQRTREIGIRMALGAERKQILRLVLSGGVRMATPGLLAGGVVALALSRLLRGFLLGVAPETPRPSRRWRPSSSARCCSPASSPPAAPPAWTRWRR